MRTILPIFKSGWGLLFIATGIISLGIDIINPTVTLEDGSKIEVLSPGSAILGWMFIFALFIVPAAIMRHLKNGPLPWPLAVLWCIVVFLGWTTLRAHQEEEAKKSRTSALGGYHQSYSTSQPPRPNFAMLAGMILCWRFLRRPMPADTQSEPADSPLKEPEITTQSMPGLLVESSALQEPEPLLNASPNTIEASMGEKLLPTGTVNREMGLKLLERIAIAIATKTEPELLSKIHLLTTSTFQWSPEQVQKKLDGTETPSAVTIDGKAIFVHLRQDGRGQLNFFERSGLETTWKFWLPMDELHTA